VGLEDQAESELIAQEYEEEAALGGAANDVDDLAIRLRKIEERLATIEDYLGRPSSKDTLEARLEQLESGG
jgi:oligoendopeptidase F